MQGNHGHEARLEHEGDKGLHADLGKDLLVLNLEEGSKTHAVDVVFQIQLVVIEPAPHFAGHLLLVFVLCQNES